MAAQCGHLLGVMDHHNVALGIVPFSARRSVWPMPTFTNVDDARAHADTLDAALSLTQPSEVELYARTFERFPQGATKGLRRVLLWRRPCRPFGVKWLCSRAGSGTDLGIGAEGDRSGLQRQLLRGCQPPGSRGGTVTNREEAALRPLTLAWVSRHLEAGERIVRTEALHGGITAEMRG